MTEAVGGVSQTDYMKLFMQELSYQDPLKPIDNREFMAQMAQFSALQQAQETTQSLNQLVGLSTGNQALMLIGKYVTLKGGTSMGKVTTVSFPQNDIPRLTVTTDDGPVQMKLEDITQVQ